LNDHGDQPLAGEFKIEVHGYCQSCGLG
jgi:hypothetical protein